MDAILMDYAADPQLGIVKENKITSVKATYLSTWTCTHSPTRVSYGIGAGVKNAISIMVGNTKLIPIGQDLDSHLILINLEDEIKSKKYLGEMVKDRHNQTIAKSWALKH